MEDLINGPMVDTLHSHHLLCKPTPPSPSWAPSSPHTHPHECMQCNFCARNFREWSSSFRDIRQGLNSQAALFTGIAIENSVKRVFRTLSNIETTIDCLMDLKMRWNKGFSLRMTQIVSWIQDSWGNELEKGLKTARPHPSPNEVSLISAF